jgi:hypothetical protein
MDNNHKENGHNPEDKRQENAQNAERQARNGKAIATPGRSLGWLDVRLGLLLKCLSLPGC